MDTITAHPDTVFIPPANTRKVIYAVVALACLLPVVTPPIALFAGIVLAQFAENPEPELTHKATNWLLKAAVVGLGFGMNIYSTAQAGREGLIFTVASITGVLLVGLLAGKLFKTDKKTSLLITIGTAICGGSAIAAVSPVIAADKRQVSVALGTVFVLNAAALFIFPAVGQALHLSQAKFGLWCAIAIHDTSSVVGAAAKYGEQALQVATAVKLARALWIIPVAFGAALLYGGGNKRVKLPWFIALFVLAMLVNTFLPFVKPLVPYLTAASKAGLTLTLFLIGTSLSFKAVKQVGIKPLLQGTMLWLLVSGVSLWAIVNFA
ncbi:YeiH family protein [Mucilaginibacter pedocola]|uniref:Sulfate exporter family transporter n=1 Tax=Mucilaginibacter pedocola TaxID=1792845 RepID=A0A1S9PHT7_9SPHI|nr:putative sulfate exporter family transporter [Mucilaginibacter pedocola]OOQ60507.1 hypothetical protein BC343_24765 [Mucilaginibacter pedocola]